MTTPHDKALSELRDRLKKMPKADRGISWQLYNWQNSEELTVYRSIANCLKWILDNTDELVAALHTPIPEAGNDGDGKAFAIGDRVRKTKGSSWQGNVVGFYSTELTPIGYCVESEREPGSVQIYPETALEVIPSHEGREKA